MWKLSQLQHVICLPFLCLGDSQAFPCSLTPCYPFLYHPMAWKCAKASEYTCASCPLTHGIRGRPSSAIQNTGHLLLRGCNGFFLSYFRHPVASFLWVFYLAFPMTASHDSWGKILYKYVLTTWSSVYTAFPQPWPMILRIIRALFFTSVTDCHPMVTRRQESRLRLTGWSEVAVPHSPFASNS